MATMKAVDVRNGAGPTSALFINDSIPKPSLSTSQCLVHVKAFGLNRADTLQREGKYPVPPGVTKIMGLEFSGVIEAVGDDSSSESEERHHFKVGDEVFGLTYGGAYAEYVAVSKRMLVRKPASLSWEASAGLPEVWMTALQALYLVGGWNSSTMHSVVWHAGASAVSIAGAQLSKEAGASKVFATARQDEKCSYLEKELGLTAAVNTTTRSEWEQDIIKANDGKGVDLIVDYTSAGYFRQNLDLLALDGKMVILAQLGGTKLPAETDIGALLRKRLRIEGSTLRSRAPEYQEKLRDLFEEKVLQNVVDGKFKAPIDTVLDWSKIAQAHELLETNKTKGKVVCTVPW